MYKSRNQIHVEISLKYLEISFAPGDSISIKRLFNVTVRSLKYAQRAKKITNTAAVKKPLGLVRVEAEPRNGFSLQGIQTWFI